ncbi:MAG TPA: tol-pal system-associated acyl-CoA thioesterase [Rudaea sp.]|jgi:acyl-CoA thioester hydrolase|nr:tol-pal system-associated acyl-CoA thioesterase [Rudaea sp.]
MSRLARGGQFEVSSDRVFSWPIRVYWEDTDGGGVVYHASYLRFIERARTEWLRLRGVEQQALRGEHGILFVVSEMDIRFLSPARLDEELVATIESFTRRSASMTFSQCILRPADGARLVEARVRAACIDGSDFKPRRIPDFLFHS